MSIPEPSTAPAEPAREVLERALYRACWDQFVLLRAADRQVPEPTDAHTRAVVGHYLTLAATDLQRWVVTDAGREYLRDYPLSSEDAL
jgi:hypothetical protein